MKRLLVAVLTTIGLLTATAGSALAADNPDWHAKCVNREAPSKAYFGEGWVNVRDDGANWSVLNIYGKIRSVDLPINGNNQLAVEVFDLSHGMKRVAYHEFQQIANADLTLTADVYPFVPVPKGQLVVRIIMITAMDSFPKNCSGAGIAF